MKKQIILFIICLASTLTIFAVAGEPSPSTPTTAAVATYPGTVAEARVRSHLLHDMIHGALQVMHRDFFRDGGQRMPIPSEALEEVFAELDKSWQVKINWLAVNAPAMNDDNRPQTTFDHAAVKAISDGAEQFDEVEDDTYRFAGQVVLGNQCLKCHVPSRTTLEDRKAAVVISMPLSLTDVAASPSNDHR